MNPRRDRSRKATTKDFVFDGLVIDPRDRKFCEELAPGAVRPLEDKLDASREAALPSRSGSPVEPLTSQGSPREVKPPTVQGFWTRGKKIGAGLAIAGTVTVLAGLFLSKRKELPVKRKDTTLPGINLSPMQSKEVIRALEILRQGSKKPWWKFW